MSGVFGSLFTICIFLIPILTMRLYSEEKKHLTDQLLLTAPISLFSLVMGKFLAALIMLALGLSVTLAQATALSFIADVGWPVILSSFAGLMMMGSALIAVCSFISSLTENQLIAAVGSFAASLFLIIVDSLSTAVYDARVASLLEKLSFYRRAQDFMLGLFGLSGTVFFLSVAALFIFFTAMSLEKRRWS